MGTPRRSAGTAGAGGDGAESIGDGGWRSAQLQQLRDQVLAVLPGPDQPPASTTDLAAALRLTPYEQSVRLWPVLDRLVKDGVAERIVRDGYNVRFWRRAATTSEPNPATAAAASEGLPASSTTPAPGAAAPHDQVTAPLETDAP
ncbi:hypothetical protein [Dactylosporangium sp. CA-139066]|uniref:hypothetical protein n=1 Tax=Dactylosporangium sp. CA-139066 TaxID=3239930 RepID=UPI003D8B6255